MERKYWQVAAGSGSRDYAERFLQFGMAFVGGKEPIATMNQVSVGDIILLKRGLSAIVAVGEVVARNGQHSGDMSKEWLRDFDGWDLSAFCYVDWRRPDTPIATTGLTRTTIQRVPQQMHREIADATLKLPVVPYAPEPAPTAKLEDVEILTFLISKGLRPSAADELTATLRRIRLLADYYYNGKMCLSSDRSATTRLRR
jgi:hypothetical protein